MLVLEFCYKVAMQIIKEIDSPSLKALGELSQSGDYVYGLQFEKHQSSLFQAASTCL